MVRSLVSSNWAQKKAKVARATTTTTSSQLSAVAVDCEMVGCDLPPGTSPDHPSVCRRDGYFSRLARVAVVDEDGVVLLDELVRPDGVVRALRAFVTGLTMSQVVRGMSEADARAKVKKVMHGRLVVGHALDHDLRALDLHDWLRPHMLRDTSTYRGLRTSSSARTPGLRSLVDTHLKGQLPDFQQGSHSPVDDARAAMLLYRLKKKEWEKSMERSMASARRASESLQRLREQKAAAAAADDDLGEAASSDGEEEARASPRGKGARSAAAGKAAAKKPGSPGKSSRPQKAGATEDDYGSCDED